MVVNKTPKGLSEHLMSPNKYVPPSEVPGQNDAVKEADGVKKKLEGFKKKLLKKFPFMISLSILPANSFKLFDEDGGLVPEEIEKKPLHVMMVIPEEEFKNIPKKIKPEVLKLVGESKENLWIHIKTPVDVWNYGLDSKFEFIDAIGGSFPLHDTGFLGALRVSAIHKTLVLRKFEKYIASYVIAGSLVRGTADETSDVDVFIVVDDTDVKRMPRVQLLEKLRGMIHDYIREATALAGVKNILNVQVYLLTDFWQSVKDAVPVIFTFIRDGIPMYDRGTFLPWKMLLQMGKIKPSPEAVDQFMKYGDQNENLVNRRLMDAMVDIYWGVVTPIQALMMIAGEAPPVPKHLVEEVKKAFVDKEKIMGQKELKVLEKAVKLYKDYEHGTLKKISGTEIDVFLKEAKEYDKALKEIRKKLEGNMIKRTASEIHDEVFDLLKKILGNKSKDELIKLFEGELVKKGQAQARFVPLLKEISKIKQKAKKLTQKEIDNVRKNSTALIATLTEFSQRKELIAIEKGVIRISYDDGKKDAELVVTDSGIFVVLDGAIKKVSDGKLVEGNREEMGEAIVGTKDKLKVNLSSAFLDVLKKELGGFEIVL